MSWMLQAPGSQALQCPAVTVCVSLIMTLPCSSANPVFPRNPNKQAVFRCGDPPLPRGLCWVLGSPAFFAWVSLSSDAAPCYFHEHISTRPADLPPVGAGSPVLPPGWGGGVVAGTGRGADRIASGTWWPGAAHLTSILSVHFQYFYIASLQFPSSGSSRRSTLSAFIFWNKLTCCFSEVLVSDLHPTLPVKESKF